MVYVIPNENLVNANTKPKRVTKNEANIFNSLKFFMICSHILGILPLENITTSQNELRFKWKCWKFLYTLFFIATTAFASILCVLDWFFVGYNFSSLGTTIFYAGALAILIIYMHLARSWPKLILFWCKMDKIMNIAYGYPESLNKRFHITSAIYFALALANYGMDTLNIYKNIKTKYGNRYDAEKYYLDSFPHVFRFIPFNFFSATFCTVLRNYVFIIWSVNDLFIILISIALALRFKQISERLVRNQKMFQIKSIQFWIEIREDYDRLSLLCKEVDKHVSYMILLSFSGNIFFLLLKLYDSTHAVSSFAEFGHCFVYLITKIVSVSLYAAWINDESVEPAGILNSVPASAYNIEIRRLLTQISFDNVAFTGCRMFKVTRGIILSIAGAIVTYELVLIQFNAATGDN